jgi:hypothetical protein
LFELNARHEHRLHEHHTTVESALERRAPSTRVQSQQDVCPEWRQPLGVYVPLPIPKHVRVYLEAVRTLAACMSAVVTALVALKVFGIL